jgi:hypothetical protein
LREIASGDLNPEFKAYEYDDAVWQVVLDWLQSRASIMILTGLKEMEPAINDPGYEAWEQQFKTWSDRIKGLINLRKSGMVGDDVAYLMIQILFRAKEFSDKALKFLRAKPREHLGEAERLPETEVVYLGDSDGN